MQLTVGQILEGKVTGITKFGAFVDVGEGKNGMVHISEVAQTYVSDINDHLKVGDTVKVKVLTIGEDGKVSLSIKKAMEPPKKPAFQRKPREGGKPESSGSRQPKKTEPIDPFEAMMAKFKQTSDEKFSDLKRKNPEIRRTKRGSGMR